MLDPIVGNAVRKLTINTTLPILSTPARAPEIFARQGLKTPR